MRYSPTTNNFMPWQPSTWPEVNIFDETFIEIIKNIFYQTIINEIDNVIGDAIRNNKSIEHRGHVIAIAQLCAIDTFSSYLFYDEKSNVCNECGRKDSKINKYKQYIKKFFPKEYQQFDDELYKLYRNTMIHSWNLFEVGILPDNTMPIKITSCLNFGLLNFQSALKKSVENFFDQSKTNFALQKNILNRYKDLKESAKP